MTTTTHFIFQPGIWIGEGDISFSSSPQKIHFYTKWVIGEEGPNGIICEQHIEQRGYPEPLLNRFLFTKTNEDTFDVQINSEHIQNGKGTGVFTAENIGWDFPSQISMDGQSFFQGFELYYLKNDYTYDIHAEYSSDDTHSTIIDGKLWKK